MKRARDAGAAWRRLKVNGLDFPHIESNVVGDAALEVQPRVSTRASVRANGHPLQGMEGRP
jgi:hypothetical protein